MALSKHMNVMKALVEEMLRRNTPLTKVPTCKTDVEFALKILDMMLSRDVVYIIADAHRIARDFAEALGRPFVYISEQEQLMGMQHCVANKDLIIVHTGPRTGKQSMKYHQLVAWIPLHVQDVNVWHIGEWRV